VHIRAVHWYGLVVWCVGGKVGEWLITLKFGSGAATSSVTRSRGDPTGGATVTKES